MMVASNTLRNHHMLGGMPTKGRRLQSDAPAPEADLTDLI